MRKAGFFLLGAVVGLVICFMVVYLSGVVLEYLGIRLYESEADQQRNFNVFLLVSAIASTIGGLLVAKKYA